MDAPAKNPYLQPMTSLRSRAGRAAWGLVYFLLYKPKGYVTTVIDPEGRATVMVLIKNCPARVYPVRRAFTER